MKIRGRTNYSIYCKWLFFANKWYTDYYGNLTPLFAQTIEVKILTKPYNLNFTVGLNPVLNRPNRPAYQRKYMCVCVCVCVLHNAHGGKMLNFKRAGNVAFYLFIYYYLIKFVIRILIKMWMTSLLTKPWSPFLGLSKK